MSPSRLGLLLVALGVGGSVSNAGDTTPPSEYEVKAAFIYNFARYVQWPAEAEPGSEALFVIKILGEDPFAGVLDETLRGKVVDRRPVVVRRAARLEDVGKCQILFISDSAQERLPEVLKLTQAEGILTVGEMDRFAERGGIIRFRTEKSRIRLEINLGVAERSRLKISSELLKLAQIVSLGGGS